jgi:hypothetical protein
LQIFQSSGLDERVVIDSINDRESSVLPDDLSAGKEGIIDQ